MTPACFLFCLACLTIVGTALRDKRHTSEHFPLERQAPADSIGFQAARIMDNATAPTDADNATAPSEQVALRSVIGRPLRKAVPLAAAASALGYILGIAKDEQTDILEYCNRLSYGFQAMYSTRQEILLGLKTVGFFGLGRAAVIGITVSGLSKYQDILKKLDTTCKIGNGISIGRILEVLAERGFEIVHDSVNVEKNVGDAGHRRVEFSVRCKRSHC